MLLLMNDKLEIIEKKAVVDIFVVLLLRQLPRETDGNHEKLQPGYAVSMPRTESGSYLI